MQITDEVTRRKKLKMILNWPKQQNDSKHSMNIDGRETQIDEAYLLLGKTRYYDQGLFLR
jgi:hypothetical protein